MIETLQLMPPATGPQANPLLFGVAEALALLFPVVKPHDGHPSTIDRADGEAVDEGASTTV